MSRRLRGPVSGLYTKRSHRLRCDTKIWVIVSDLIDLSRIYAVPYVDFFCDRFRHDGVLPAGRSGDRSDLSTSFRRSRVRHIAHLLRDTKEGSIDRFNLAKILVRRVEVWNSWLVRIG